MISSIKGPFKNWFGYNRRERRSTFILLILILAIVGLRFVLPDRDVTVEEIPQTVWESFTDTLNYKKAPVLNQEQKDSRVSFKQRALLNINTCDSASLEALRGIGPVLSARIVKYRNLLGGYSSIEQLREVYGLSDDTFKLIAPKIFADSTEVRKIKINSADYKGLIRLPYFDRYEVATILKYRELKGRIKNIDDLIDNKIITTEKAVKIKPYLEFGE